MYQLIDSRILPFGRAKTSNLNPGILIELHIRASNSSDADSLDKALSEKLTTWKRLYDQDIYYREGNDFWITVPIDYLEGKMVPKYKDLYFTIYELPFMFEY